LLNEERAEAAARIQSDAATIANLTDALHIQNKQAVELAEENAQLRAKLRDMSAPHHNNSTATGANTNPSPAPEPGRWLYIDRKAPRYEVLHRLPAKVVKECDLTEICLIAAVKGLS